MGEYCLSTCVKNCLNANSIVINEEDLFLDKRVLDIKIDNDFSSLSSCVSEIILEWCKKHCKLHLKNEKLGVFLINDNIWSRYMLNINVKFLNYSPTYTRTKTNQPFHFVNILGVKENRILILDGCIPTNPKTQYMGYIDYSEEMDENCRIYEIQKLPLMSELSLNQFQRRKIIKEAVNRRKKGIKEKDVFQEYISLIQKINARNFFEIAVSFAVNGIDTIFEMLKRNLLLLNICQNNIIDIINNLKKYIFSLRVLLIKYYISQNKNDLSLICRKLSIIRDTESLLYSELII